MGPGSRRAPETSKSGCLARGSPGRARVPDLVEQAGAKHAEQGFGALVLGRGEVVGAVARTPNPTQPHALRERWGKVLVVHNTSDPIFSIDDTAAWYRALDATYGGKTGAFARFFPVPAMGHYRGAPATDQFDALSALVAWVERGQAPEC